MLTPGDMNTLSEQIRKQDTADRYEQIAQRVGIKTLQQLIPVTAEDDEQWNAQHTKVHRLVWKVSGLLGPGWSVSNSIFLLKHVARIHPKR